MTIAIFLIVFGAGAAALALWTDVRFDSWRPAELRWAMLHIGLAWCIAHFLSGVPLHFVASAFNPLGAVIGVGLPITMYCMLSMLWLMRLATGALKSRFE